MAARNASQGTFSSESLAASPRARLWLVVRFLLGLAGLVLLIALLVHVARPELEGLGAFFVERLGLFGVACGTFLADGFHFPIPPQFYMLLAIAAGAPALGTLAATICGSVLAGFSGFALAGRLGRIPKLERLLRRAGGGAAHAVAQKLGHEYAYRSVIVVSLTPMAFSVLCYLAGLYQMRRGPFLLLVALRVPKLVLYYYLVKIGWTAP